MALPSLGIPNITDPSVLIATMIEPFLNPLRQVKNNNGVNGLTDFSSRLIGINTIAPALSSITNAVNPFKKRGGKFSGNSVNEEIESSDASMGTTITNDLQILLQNSIESSETYFNKMSELLSDILLVSEESLDIEKRISLETRRKQILSAETIAESNQLQEKQLKTLEELSESISENKGGFSLIGGFSAILAGIKAIGMRLLAITGITKVAGLAIAGISGILGLGSSLLGKAKGATNKGVGGIASKLLGPAVLAYKANESFRSSGESQKKFGNKGSFLGTDTSKLNAGIGEFLGGRGNGKANASAKAKDLAMTGAAVGLMFGPVGAVIGGLIGGVVGAISGYFGGDKIANALGSIQTIVEGMFNTLKTGFTQLYDWGKNTFNFVVNVGKNIIGVFQSVKTFFVDDIPAKFNELKNSIMNIDLIGSVTSTFSEIGNKLSSVFEEMVNSISYFVYDSLSSLGSAGEKVAKFIFSESDISKFQKINDANESPVKPNVVSSMISDVSNIKIPDIIPSASEAKQMIDAFNDVVLEQFNKVKIEAAKLQEQDSGKSTNTIIRTPVPIQIPVPMNNGAGSSQPILVSPKPIRNNRMNDYNRNTKFVN